MNRYQRTARVLIGLGCFIVLTGSALHLFGGYPQVRAALATSNLREVFKDALRAVFLLIALNWIVVAVVALMATFARTQTSKPIVLVCGFGLLVQIPIWVAVMGWFVGNKMFGLGAGLIVCGGLLIRGSRRPSF